MNGGESFPGFICRLLERGSSAVLATIIDVQGSSPRHKGTKMVIGEDGSISGTVGGSLLEANIVKEAKNILAAGYSRQMVFDSTGNSVNADAMICGGKTTVMLDYITDSDENKKFFQHWEKASKNAQVFYVLTQFKESDNNIEVTGRSLWFSDGKIIGTPFESFNSESLKAELPAIRDTSARIAGEIRMVIDPIRSIMTLYCFGAGHVAVPTARIATMVGFRVVIVDQRPDMAKADRFPEVDSICLIQDFHRAMEGLDINSNSFIVIFTPSHEYDRAVLEQALETSAGYIGMISSRRKKEAIFQYLIAKGVKKEALERVHTPIGLTINAETPEEIAISIVAELILERAKLNHE